MNKEEFLEIWKQDKIKAMNILFYAFLKDKMDNEEELSKVIDFIEKEFKINIREYAKSFIEAKKQENKPDYLGIALSGIMIFNEIAKKFRRSK